MFQRPPEYRVQIANWQGTHICSCLGQDRERELTTHIGIHLFGLFGRHMLVGR